MRQNRYLGSFVIIGIFLLSCSQQQKNHAQEQKLHLVKDKDAFVAYRSLEDDKAILTQVVKEGVRPYIHPIVAPDGNGVLTEYSPGHHLHQTGLYWGLKRVNERDYFMNWKESHWKKISAKILEEEGPVVRWQTEYGLLDENGKVILTEVQEWSMQESDGGYILDLEWKGNAKIDITLGEFYVGGLFLRMPWKKGDIAAIINSNGQNNLKAEGQRAIWTDLGVQVEGRNDMAHIAILDHPDNRAFPTPWRVDTQFGFGPSIQILGDWKIKEAETEIIKYRLIIYTGDRDKGYISRAWKELVCRD